MSEVGVHETFLWETQLPWSFKNSDNSGWKPPDSGSNAQTPTGKEAAPALAPLPPKGRKRSSAGCNNEKEISGCGGDQSDHEIHIWTERERRKKMRNMFSNLHALLPQLPPKADKSTIVDEAVCYIKSLQQQLHKLQRRKLERLHGYETSIKLGIDTREAFMADQVSANTSNNNAIVMSVPRFLPPAFQTWTSPNVVLNVCGDQAQYNVCAVKKSAAGLFTAICYVMEKHKIDVVHASISASHNSQTLIYFIQAQARMVPDQGYSLEDIYKQAAAEIMLWVSSSSSLAVIN